MGTQLREGMRTGQNFRKRADGEPIGAAVDVTGGASFAATANWFTSATGSTWARFAASPSESRPPQHVSMLWAFRMAAAAGTFAITASTEQSASIDEFLQEVGESVLMALV